jgi:hypothetical protein
MQDEPNGTSYRVLMPLAAMVAGDGGHLRIVAIPRESVFVARVPSNPFALVEIDWDGRKLAVYSRDIEERTERLLEVTRRRLRE